MSFDERAPPSTRVSRLSSRSTRIINVSVKNPLEYDKYVDQYFEADPPREHKDCLEYSNEPSYTDFKVPYHILTAKRYARARSNIEQQFQYEIRQLMNSMDSAYEAARFMRHISVTTFWPPLHNRFEIFRTQQNFFKLDKQQQNRLNYLMKTNII